MAKDRFVTVAPTGFGGKISIRLDPGCSEAENDRRNHTQGCDREGPWGRPPRRDIKILGVRLK
jgi:hypothetical protein